MRLMPPLAMLANPINAVTTKFVRTSTNKMRCPIFCVVVSRTVLNGTPTASQDGCAQPESSLQPWGLTL
ncbi:hypothetical protein HPB50_005766 [Hyalomma asiaticum]|uniref:Uncharacterized protein n=1 Tax=Hyalomma asiaticum TaxID=266040 RepID=A0ACB7SEC4_HYAAI|nr:hypothetical protein HPB50_005766 [Hyalomma asiaticum]